MYILYGYDEHSRDALALFSAASSSRSLGNHKGYSGYSHMGQRTCAFQRRQLIAQRRDGRTHLLRLLRPAERHWPVDRPQRTMASE
jgi:hypothetical protein